MIQSTSSSDRTAGPGAFVSFTQQPALPPAVQGQDSVTLGHTGQLQSALGQQPEIRPEMVEKGRALAADPDYPSAAIIQGLAGMILNSPDPSEDRS